MAQRIVLLLTVFTAIFSVSVPAWVQTLPSLSGVVVDTQSGLPISSVNITLINTPYGTTSDAEGRFYFYQLPNGHFDLKVSHIGYWEFRQRNVSITWDHPVYLEIYLTARILQLPEETVVTTQPEPSAGTFSGGVVLSRNIIASSGSNDLGRILEQHGLATVSSDGSPGGKQTVTLRGSNGDQVLVLVDGKPLNEAADGSADLSRISLTEIQQIEIYPQAPSSLGAQAIGGVINIITIAAGRDQFALKAGFSGFGEKQGSLLLGRSISSWKFLCMYEHSESSGKYRYQVVPDDGLDLFTRSIGETFTRKNAEYQRDYLTVKLNPPGLWTLTYRRDMLFRQNPDYLPLPVLAHESTSESDHQELAVTWEGTGQGLRPRLTLQYESYRQSSLTDYGSQYPLLYDNSSLRGEVYNAGLDWKRKHDFWENLNFGTGIRLERLWSEALTAGYAERLHEFGYFQAQGNPLRSLELPIKTGIFSGVRADLYSGAEVFVYPRLGVELKAGEQLYGVLRCETAGAFRLPSFNALFWKEDLQSQGNPNLKPERAQNQEISATIGYSSVKFSVNYFDRKVWDLIYWRLDFDNRWKPLNLSRAWIYGTEYRAEYQIGSDNWNQKLLFSHRWMQALNLSGEVNTDGKFLPYRPEHSSAFSLQQNLKYLNADITARWVGRRYTNEANTKSLTPYQVWDLGGSRDFQVSESGTSVNCRVEVLNLFNAAYRTVDAAPLPLREWCISISLQSN